MKLQAFGTTIIVEPEFESNQTDTGILLRPRKLEKAPNTGTVVSVGSEVDNVAVGERIIFHTKKNNPQGFNFDDKKYIYIENDEVFGKL
jgi:co-chaperonin GroES (HSP10)